MTRALAFTPRASADIEDTYHWYETRRTGLGDEFKVALKLGLDLIRSHPEVGPMVHRDLRRILLARFPYALYYRVTDTAIEVRGCFHQRRHPRTWRRRA